MQDAPKGGLSLAQFEELLANSNWATVQDMKAVLDRAGFWPVDYNETSAEIRKLEDIRKLARRLRRKDGRQTFVHVRKRLPDGRKVDIYKQLVLFDINDYRFTVNYHKQIGIHHMVKANQFARDCRTFLGKQLPLPFPDIAKRVA